MKITNKTKEVLRCRRERRRLLAEGYEEVGEGGGRLWELYRGRRVGYVITDVKIAPEGLSLFIKTVDTVKKISPSMENNRHAA
jgi:hypothetical protein